MKKILSIFLVLIISISFFSCGDNNKNESENSNNSTTSNFKKVFGIKSAIVDYVISGSQEGTKTLYFDDWGMKQAEYTKSVLTVGNFTKLINKVSITDGEYEYNINMNENSGTRIRNPILKKMEELQNQKGFNEFGEQMLLSMGANKVGSEEFLGKNCDVYEIRSTGTKLWVWEWITLKSETKSGGIEILLTARKLRENVQVPADKFKVPEKVILNEVDLDNLENEMREENK